MHCGRVRRSGRGRPPRAALALAIATSGSSASTVTCPILRPRRGSALPYRCSLARRACEHARQSGSRGAVAVASSNHTSPSRFTITAGVCWRGVAERQVGEHARLLLELRRDAGVDRVVAAVVRARRDLVDEQRAVARDEHLDAQHAAVVERRPRRAVAISRASSRSAAVDARRHDRHVEDAVAMAVLGDRPGRRPRRGRCARRSPRPRRRASTQLLEHARLAAASRRTRPRTSSRVRDAHLALAVVAEARALDDAGQQRGGRRRAQSSSLRSTANGATAKPWPREERLLADAVLRDARRSPRPGVTRAARARKSSAAAGTFSNSVVAARAQRGELGERARHRDSRRAMWRSATLPAGRRSPGSSTATL